MNSKKLNVIQVSFGRYPLPYTGAGGDNIVYLISELLAKNNNLEVGMIDFATKKRQKLNLNFKIFEVPNFIYWDDNDIFRIPKVILFSISVAIKIFYLCVTRKVDIIHFHNQFSATVGILLKKIFLFKYLVFYTVHSVEILFPPPINLLRAPLEIFVLKNADYIIPTTFTTYRVLNKRYKVPLDKMRQIFLGVEKVEFKNGYKYNKNMITYVSRISERKNQLTLLKAVKILKNTFPEIICNFIGHISEKKYYAILKDFVAKNSLEKNVIFYGSLGREDMFKIVSNSYLCAMPSTYETQGLMLVESIFYGVPVVASDIGPFRDIFKLNSNIGILVSPYDYEGFADSIKRLLLDEILHLKMVDEIKKFAQIFSWENIVKEIKDFYFYAYEKSKKRYYK